MSEEINNEREERAWDALLVSTLRRVNTDDDPVDPEKLPPLSSEEERALNDLAADFSHLVLEDDRLGQTSDPEEASWGSSTEDSNTAGADNGLDFLEPCSKPNRLGQLAHYEIIEVLGKGGMGIVLCGWDTILDRRVAIKVMMPRLASDESARKRFLREAQSAAAVSHDHIVTIHAVDHTNNVPYLVMEYVEGRSLEDRIGSSAEQLTVDEIVQIGTEIALGLEAAHTHTRKLVHRDIKPANILLARRKDGPERAKISDFGLARAADDVTLTQSGNVLGTPLYMSPEQAEGKEVDHRTDLFSLGSLLYAMCTRHAPFQATSVLAVLKRVCEDTPQPIRQFNPEVPEWLIDIIDKLMAKNPKDRFQSATEVVDAFKRGPVASVEDVIEEHDHKTPSLINGRILLSLAFVLIVLVVWLSGQVNLFRQMPTELGPRELTVRARKLLQEVGYTRPPGDSASGFATDEHLLNYLRGNSALSKRLDDLRNTGQPPAMYFWYRETPGHLAQRLTPADTTCWSMPGRVLPNVPPMNEPGMTCVILDMKGRLLELHAVPPRTSSSETFPAMNWTPLLEAAEFETIRMTPGSTRKSPVYADEMVEGRGRYPHWPELPVHIEGASFEGKPVFFHVGPPEHPERLYDTFVPEEERWVWQESLYTLLGLIALPIGGWLAWNNWRLRRANPRGAFRLLFVYAGLAMSGWLLAAKHVLQPGEELAMFAGMLGRVTVDGSLLWLAYMAVEPWVRQRKAWRKRAISWNRLLEGQWKNDLVGRHVLLGVLGGSAWVAILFSLQALPRWLGWPPLLYNHAWEAAFTEGFGAVLLTGQYTLMIAMRDFFLFFVLLWVSSKFVGLLPLSRGKTFGGLPLEDWLAAGVITAFWVTPRLLDAEYIWIGALIGVGFSVLGLLLLFRVGLLAYVVFHLVADILNFIPLTLDQSSWSAHLSNLTLLVVFGLAGYGCWASFREQQTDSPAAVGRAA